MLRITLDCAKAISYNKRNIPSDIENHIAQIVKVFQIHSGARTSETLSTEAHNGFLINLGNQPMDL